MSKTEKTMSIQSILAMALIFCSAAFAQIQGETPALTPFAAETGTRLVAMPTYTYSRATGTLGLKADEETWVPEKWRSRQVFSRFVPAIDWEQRQREAWFYVGNETGDMLWQELLSNETDNSVPMLYGGFASKPFLGGFCAMAEFNQIDHFSASTFNSRRSRINSQKFSWFGENLPAYSGVFSGLGYGSDETFFKKASVLAGSEYLWAWDKEEWVPIRISPRVEGNASFRFMENEVELTASAEKFQAKDSAAESRSHFGLRLIGKNTGGGLHVNRTKGNENIAAWTDFRHSFLNVLSNKGFVALGSEGNQIMGNQIPGMDKPLFAAFADSLELEIKLGDFSMPDLVLGTLVNQNGIKLYGETIYEFKTFSFKTKAYQNYSPDFESVGFDSEVAYKSRLAEAGAIYSRELFDYYRDGDFYDVKPSENSAKFFLKYRFFQDLAIAHELIYRSTPGSWLWNAQAEQRIPEWNSSLYAVLLNAVSKNRKDFSFGGVNTAKFYCGVKVAL